MNIQNKFKLIEDDNLASIAGGFSSVATVGGFLNALSRDLENDGNPCDAAIGMAIANLENCLPKSFLTMQLTGVALTITQDILKSIVGTKLGVLDAY